jgi:antigen flippase
MTTIGTNKQKTDLEQDRGSYGQIVQSSSIMAGSASITMLMSLARMKMAALFMGSAGVGLLSVLSNLQLLISTLSGLGLQTSAVREIAEAVGRNDHLAVARTVQILRKVSIFTGVVGMLATISLSGVVSLITFGNSDYAADVGLLGVAVLLLNLAGAHLATLQGMRYIGSLAKVNALAAFVGTAITALLYYLFGLKAVAPSLVTVSACQYLAARYFAFRILGNLHTVVSWSEIYHSSGPMIKLGLALMWSSLVGQLSIFILNAYITSTEGLQSTGLYTAASMVSGIFVGFLLSAMSADFYPRLAGLSNNKPEMSELINQQTEIGLLVTVPGLILTMSFADFVLVLFYSSEFTASSSLLVWFVMACFIRIISWPLGYALLAIGRKGLYAVSETVFNLGSIALVAPAIHFYGLMGGAVVYVLCYVMYCLGIYLTLRNLIELKWSRSVWQLSVGSGFLLSVILIFVHILPPLVNSIIGGVVALCLGLLNFRGVLRRLGSEHRISKLLLRVPGMRFLVK